MATGEQLSHSVINASAEVVDNPCNICLTRDNKEIESVKYCLDCDSNLCNACDKWHQEFPSMKAHEVVSISKAASGRRQRVPLPTQRCREHHGKIIDKFCLDHEALACDSCVSLHHRSCKRMQYIPVVSKDTKKGKESQAIITSAKSLLKALKNMKSSRQDTLRQLDTAERQSQQAVKDQRDDLVKWIDGLAKTDSATITSKFQKKQGAVKKEIQNVDDQIDATELIIKGLNESKGDNQSELFVYIKQGKTTEKEGKQLIHTLQQSRTMIPKYKFHKSVEKSLSHIKTLGEFEEEALRLKPVTVKLRGEHNVKSTGDESVCYIFGACCLPDGSVIIADYRNTSLKRLDNSYKVTASLGMSSVPRDVCYTNVKDEVAVTLIDEKKIQFVRVGASMRKTRSFSTDDYCRSIALSDGELFVGCGESDNDTAGNVRVFNLAGKHLRTIQFDAAGQRLFSVINDITVSSCGRKLHVTDRNKGIVTTDRQGNLLATFTDPDLKSAAGVCTLDNGDLIVCGCGSNNVLHVSRDGRKLGVVLGEQDGIVYPIALAYDRINARLVITTADSDTIKIYDVHVE